MFARQCAHRVDVALGNRDAAHCPLRILQRDQPRAREVHVIRPDRRTDRVQRQRAVGLHRHCARVYSAQRRDASRFVDVRVRPVTQDDLIAAPAVRQHSDQVAHRAAGDEQPGFFAQALRCPLLQPVDGRILPEHVVANRCLRHSPAHLRRRPGHRVAAQINAIHTALPLSRARAHKAARRMPRRADKNPSTPGIRVPASGRHTTPGKPATRLTR